MSTMGPSPGLLDLPEEVICEILRLLDATTLYLLSRTCTRLDDIIRGNVTLWRHIDARRAPNSPDKLTYCLDRCYDDGNTWTHTLLVRGDDGKAALLPRTFLSKIGAFANLTVLAFERQTINAKKYNAMSFPPQLQELSLRKTAVSSPLKFFKGSGQHFKRLRVLVLDECDWLTSASFMPIAKYGSLEVLSVYKCPNVENSIAYLSIAGQGFKSLKVFDARLSSLGNTLIRAIYGLQSLLAIYLQNKDVSYKLDYCRRKLEIAGGSGARNFNDGDEFDLEEEEKEAASNSDDNEMLDDNGLIDYLAVPSDGREEQLPKSVLYVDPYNTCTCGYEEGRKKAKHGSNSNKDDDDDDDDSGDKRKFLTAKIEQIAHLLQLSQTGNHSRSLPDTRHPPNTSDTLGSFFRSESSNLMGDMHICLNISLGSQGTQRIIYGQIGYDDSEEPPSKRPRTEEPAPGPSGRRPSSDSEEEPPPHPAVDAHENIVYKIASQDAPIVHIENREDANRDMKVALRRLSLRGYRKITNTALRYIGDLDLDLLDLTYTSVTFEGVQKYLTSHPLCRVVHERFCTCLPNLHF